MSRYSELSERVRRLERLLSPVREDTLYFKRSLQDIIRLFDVLLDELGLEIAGAPRIRKKSETK